MYVVNFEFFSSFSIQDRKIDQFEQSSGQIAILFKPNTIRLLNSEQKTDESRQIRIKISMIILIFISFSYRIS